MLALRRVVVGSRKNAGRFESTEPYAVISFVGWGGEHWRSSPRIKHPHNMLGRIIVRCDDCAGKLFPPYVPMSERQAARVAAFVLRLASKVDVLFIHCEQGLGRSPGAGRAVADAYGIPMENISEDWESDMKHNEYIESMVAKALAGLRAGQNR